MQDSGLQHRVHTHYRGSNPRSPAIILRRGEVVNASSFDLDIRKFDPCRRSHIFRRYNYEN